VQAAAALKYALPLLQRAAQVDVLAFAEQPNRIPPVQPDHDESIADAELAALQAFLARHGVAASVARRADPIDAGYALIDAAARLGSELIVMGCYGHARLREFCLGGVSRTLLHAATVPLLAAHR
jgi:nucleotide-binding universal stress UspA family protein